MWRSKNSGLPKSGAGGVKWRVLNLALLVKYLARPLAAAKGCRFNGWWIEVDLDHILSLNKEADRHAAAHAAWQFSSISFMMSSPLLLKDLTG